MSIRNFFRSLAPSFWIMNDPYSPALDRFINKSLDAGLTPKRLSRYTVRLGGLELWAENWPYGYGTAKGFRPSRATIVRLRDEVDAVDFPLTGAAT